MGGGTACGGSDAITTDAIIFKEDPVLELAFTRLRVKHKGLVPALLAGKQHSDGQDGVQNGDRVEVYAGQVVIDSGPSPYPNLNYTLTLTLP